MTNRICYIGLQRLTGNKQWEKGLRSVKWNRINMLIIHVNNMINVNNVNNVINILCYNIDFISKKFSVLFKAKKLQWLGRIRHQIRNILSHINDTRRVHDENQPKFRADIGSGLWIRNHKSDYCSPISVSLRHPLPENV